MHQLGNLAHEPKIVLVDGEEINSCPFWISSYTPGDADCQSVMKLPDARSILNQLSKSGLNEDSQIMLSNSSVPSPFRILLLTHAEINDQRQVEELVSTISAWPSEKVGFNLISCDFELSQVEDFLATTISRLLGILPGNEFLVSRSKKGAEFDLSLLSGIKRRLNNQGINITIYH